MRGEQHHVVAQLEIGGGDSGRKGPVGTVPQPMRSLAQRLMKGRPASRKMVHQNEHFAWTLDLGHVHFNLQHWPAVNYHECLSSNYL